ncbi:6-hydroxymethylpterin diphosphokinase MptE-like protein [Tannerella forsythia]|nr:6-hydroxymethylpterin diphosphokinase MptE-like protein [Tannerella forsythia]
MIDTFLSVIRVLFQSQFRKTDTFIKKHKKCIVMGNGPSLIETLERIQDGFSNYDLIAVNHMAMTVQYERIKPSVYVLCDPAFWFAIGYEVPGEKARVMYQSMIEKTTWPLQVYIPNEAKKTNLRSLLEKNKNISLHFYNKTKFEGFKKVSHWIYKKQWGIPRAQNVLVAALMLSIHSQYKEIFLAGADNDWIRNLWVDEKNRLRLNDIHYYKEEKNITERILPILLHEQCLSLYFVFKGYMDIKLYAEKRSTCIYNMNKRSFIDAFEKTECSSIC